MPDAEAHQIRPVEPAAWDEFVTTAAGSTPFCTEPWLTCAAKAAGVSRQALGVYRREQLIAGVSGCEYGRGWRRRFATPDLLPHTGFLFRPATTDRPAHVESERVAATSALVAHLQAAYPRVQLTHPPALTDARPFLWSGWDVAPRYTYLVELPPDRQQVWDGFERRTRTAVRKAEKGGYRVEAATDTAELRHLYGLVYGTEAQAPVAGAVVEAMAHVALDEGLAQGHRVVSPAGDTAAVVLFAERDERLYAWVAGADPAHRDTGATSLLYWRVLEQATAHSFDFVGANLAPIALFKRGFGGCLTGYYATSSRPGRHWRAASALRGLLR